MLFDSATERTMARPQEPGIMTRALDQVRQIVCSLHGHDALLHFEQGRMSLRCTSCGYQTPGWDLHAEPTRENVTQKKARVLHLSIVRERRVA
jgi:hypothetical protein